ncbi:MAG: Dabb family protein [Clostridiales bacterium]|nr:Dabb family protein [Clostridiales bacterium]
MVKHIVAWNWADHLTEEEKEKNARLMKKELENLINLIPGIISIKLYTKPLQSSDSDLLLDSEFESEEALNAYQVHPEHVRVGNNYVRPVVKNRKCIDIIMD